MSGYGNGFGYPDPYGLDPEDIEDVVAEGLDRLYEFYKDHDTGDRPNIRALVIILLSRLQAFEDAVGSIVARLSLDDADGWWLDNVFGKLVDLRRRNGWLDDTYRFYIDTKLLALRSSGTADDLLAVARRMIPATTDPALVVFRPEYGTNRGYRMEIPDVPTSVRGLAVELMSIATSAGVRGMLIFYRSTSNFHSFRAPGTTHGFGHGVFGHAAAIVGTL